ncbi:hypothetical protein [Paenibacillus dendritiformis]|uniref:hypothetical protein n=1 Tax=Paenibacillus dendritiformis TaxID=130049 RepID=UPI000DA7268F|nr:hypothetical protein [Paenibacillus dendritiformis]PZM62603.1 hypothetical protein DOE73_26460 [Paenibacillus dendritiformis]
MREVRRGFIGEKEFTGYVGYLSDQWMASIISVDRRENECYAKSFANETEAVDGLNELWDELKNKLG